MKKYFILVLAVFLSLSMTVLSYATVDNSYSERVDEKGNKILRIIWTDGTWIKCKGTVLLHIV